MVENLDLDIRWKRETNLHHLICSQCDCGQPVFEHCVGFARDIHSGDKLEYVITSSSTAGDL